MSIVLNVLTMDNSVIAYDGRACRNGMIVDEHTTKAVMINPYVCVAFTGIFEVANDVVRILRENVVGINSMKSNEVAASIQAILKLPQAPVFTGAFLATGTDNNRKLSTHTIGTDLVIRSYFATKENVRLTQIGGDRCQLSFSEYANRASHWGSPQELMRSFIQFVAKYDDYVNTNVRFLILP